PSRSGNCDDHICVQQRHGGRGARPWIRCSIDSPTGFLARSVRPISKNPANAAAVLRYVKAPAPNSLARRQRQSALESALIADGEYTIARAYLTTVTPKRPMPCTRNAEWGRALRARWVPVINRFWRNTSWLTRRREKKSPFLC